MKIITNAIAMLQIDHTGGNVTIVHSKLTFASDMLNSFQIQACGTSLFMIYGLSQYT